MPEDNEDVIDWTGPAAEVRDQLVERWFNRHPDIGHDEGLPLAEEYADEMVHRYLR